MRASQYLLTFNIAVKHKSRKFNTVSNALSRLIKKIISSKANLDVLETLYEHVIKLVNSHELNVLSKIVRTAYYMTLIKLSNDFKTKLKNAYTKDD